MNICIREWEWEWVYFITISFVEVYLASKKMRTEDDKRELPTDLMKDIIDESLALKFDNILCCFFEEVNFQGNY